MAINALMEVVMYAFLFSIMLLLAGFNTLAIQQPNSSHGCKGTPSQILAKMQGLPNTSQAFDQCARSCAVQNYCTYNGPFVMDDCNLCLNQCIGTYGYELQPNEVINFLNEIC